MIYCEGLCTEMWSRNGWNENLCVIDKGGRSLHWKVYDRNGNLNFFYWPVHGLATNAKVTGTGLCHKSYGPNWLVQYFWFLPPSWSFPFLLRNGNGVSIMYVYSLCEMWSFRCSLHTVLPTQLFTNLRHIWSQSLIICADFGHEVCPYILHIFDELLLELFGDIFILLLYIPAKKSTLHKKHNA